MRTHFDRFDAEPTRCMGRRAKRAQLEATWQLLKVPASVLLRAAGVQGRASFNDFLWAYSVFW